MSAGRPRDFPAPASAASAEPPAAPDVLVIGGGVIGCAVARALAGRGRSVVLAERATPGCGASTAAAGVLSVAGGNDDGERLALRRASLARWPEFGAALAAETGIDLELSLCGTVELALSDDDVLALRARIERRRAQGFRVEWLEADAVRREAPAVTPEVRGAAAFPDDGQVHTGRLQAALVEAARVRGAVVLAGAEVHDVERRGARITHVAVGERRLAPGTVVLAAGAWSGRVCGLGSGTAVRPVRGQMLALRPPGAAVARTVGHGDGVLVPRADGTVLVGATMEDAGFDAAVTPAGLGWLLAHVARLAPSAVDWPLVRAWAGLRPALAGGPRIARHPDVDNLVVATGHHRNGILLAPVTADAVAALVEGTTPPPEAAPFGWPGTTPTPGGGA